MSRQREAGGIDPDLAFLQIKAFKLVNCEGREALHYIFTIACSKPEAQNLQDYLINEKNMKKQDYEKWFSENQQRKILSDPQGIDFDITLLCRCLGVPLPRLNKLGRKEWTQADESKLEFLITQIKEVRNDLAHEKEIRSEDELIKLAEHIKELLAKTYRLAAAHYERNAMEVEVLISGMEDQIDNIVHASHIKDFEEWQKVMRDLQHQQTCHVREAARELRKKYITASEIHPASFLTHVESLQIQTVYCKVDIVEQMHDKKDKKAIHHDMLLQLQTRKGKEPAVVVVEGQAGMGKTSLVKFILAEWANLPRSSNTILGLEEYDLLLHFEFRNPFISTFLDLLLVLFDNSSVLLTNEKLISSVLNLRTLVLMDGADEWNANSKLLLQELTKKIIPQSEGNLRLLCTTRPERWDALLDHVQPLPWVHIRITGVSPDKQFDFVERSMQGMLKEIKDNSDTPENQSGISPSDTPIQKLDAFMKISRARMGEQFKLPLNLALLAYLWIHNSDRICLATSATELYTAFHELALKRLLKRLDKKPEIGNKGNLKELCHGFLSVLYKECLTALAQVAMQMPQESTKRLELFCNTHGLPPSDMLENYMEVYREWDCYGYLTILVPPHKSKLEFFAVQAVIRDICATHDVQHILDQLEVVLDSNNCRQESRQAIIDFAKSQLEVTDRSTILQVLQSLHPNTEDLDLSLYQNMLLLMAGVMFQSHRKDLHYYGPELLNLLRKSGLKDYQFLSIVAEAKNDERMAQLVAQELGSQETLVVRDGHVGAALAVLPHLAAIKEVSIRLEGDPRYLPDLEDLVRLVASRPCRVILDLQRLLHTPDTNADHLIDLLRHGKCSLEHLEGHLTCQAELPTTLFRLDLSATPGSDPALPRLQHLQECLCHLDIHVPRAVTPEHLRELPPVKYSGISLHLYDVEEADVEWASRVVRALLPPAGEFRSLHFPRSDLSYEGCIALVDDLGEEPSARGGGKVRVKETLVVPSMRITDQNSAELTKYTKKKLYCKFSKR